MRLQIIYLPFLFFELIEFVHEIFVGSEDIVQVYLGSRSMYTFLSADSSIDALKPIEVTGMH